MLRRSRVVGVDLECDCNVVIGEVGELGVVAGEEAAVAVDNSESMIERARTIVTDERVTFLHADIREVELPGAGVVLLNFVLQFIDPRERGELLKRIHNSLAPDGLLVVSEKIRFEDPHEQAFHDAAHLDFKRANGYSDLEISQKRTALENVMITDSEEQHRERFAQAGFRNTRKWFQCLNWVSYLVYP